MSYLPWTSIPTTISRFTRAHRFLIITVGFVLSLGAVAISKSPSLRETLVFSRAPETSVRRQSPGAASRKINLLPSLGMNLRLREAPSVASLLAPTVSATKTDTLFTDVDGDLQADPGDTLKYTVNINASGQDATGVTFTDTVDPNTTFVAGTLRATPVAVNDTYAATGNVRISVAAPGVLGNDFTGLPNATITAPPTTSANGGDVTINADGSFTYNPPAGFEGTDTFTYTLTNSEGSNSATVTVNVSGMIWFISNNAAACTTLAAGCGRLTNPFSSLSAFASLNNGSGNNPAPNDNIFVYESAIDYVGPVTLLNGQRFIGQDATSSLSAITGLTPPAGSDPLPATNSANATIVNITTGNAITVASNNTLVGFTGGNSTTDITGSSFGTLTIADVTLNGTGQALDLTSGTLAATFVSISSANSGTTGISLSGVAGSLTTPTTTITNPAGSGITVDTSSATLSFGNTTASGSGAAGVVLGGSGIGNTGPISFGALNIMPDAGIPGLEVIDNTNTITTTSGTINSGTATAVNINRTGGTTPLNMTFTSLSSSGGTATGVMIQNTTGSFTVVGDGTNTTVGGNGSGGTIANKSGSNGSTTTGIGVYLNNALNVTLRRMTINGTNQNFGIRGTNVTGCNIEYSTVNGANGDDAILDEGSIIFDGLFGTSTFTSNAVGGSIEDNFRIRNSSGSSDVAITGSTFSNAPNDNLIIEPSGTANVSADVTNNTFTGAGGDHFQTITNNSATLTLVFTGNFYSNGFPGSLGGGITISGGSAGSTESVNFDISNNGSAGNPLIGNETGGAINVNQGAGGGTWQGQISNNFIGNAAVANSGSTQSSGIRVENHSPTGTLKAIVSNNTIAQWNGGAAINFQVGDAGNVNAALDLTVTNNNVNNPGVNTVHGVQGNFGAASTGTNAVCFDFKTNTVSLGATPPNGGSDLRLRQRNGSTVRLPGYAGANTDTTAVQTFEIGQNTLTAATAATKASVSVAVPPGGGFVGGSACSAPVVPTLQQVSQLSASSEKSAGLQSSSMKFVDSGSADSGSVDTLRAAHGEKRDGLDVQKLTQGEIAAAVQAAIERWRASGISADDIMRLQSVTFEIADLPDGVIATGTSTSVKLDETAAGYGWFSDLSPMEDSEFEVIVPGRELQAREQNPAFGRMDLLTVVMRQLGAALQRGNTPLMQNTLSTAVRRLPNAQSIQLSSSSYGVLGRNEKSVASQIRKRSTLRTKTARSTAPASSRNARLKQVAQTASNQSGRFMHHALRTTPATLSSMLADVMLNIGTLPAGESVTITFNVTVNNPFTGAMAQVSNQGTVSGTNFGDVLTDDPTVGGTADPTVTPIDLPEVSVAVSPTSVSEDGPTNLVYTFTRDGSTANPMTVNFSVGGTASFTEPDYTQTGAATFTATSGTVVIPSGSSTATVTVDPSADLTVEPDETVVLTVTSGTGYTVGSPSVATGTILNDDTSVSVAVSPGSVAEDGATNLVYTFTRTGVISTSLAVNFSVGGTATFGASPDDYTQTGATSFTPPTGVVTFAAGSSTATVTVNPEADSTVEPDETVILTVTAGSGYNVGAPASASGTITNDDTDVSVAVSPSSVAEDGATNLVYTFTRNGVTSSALTVNFSVGGTATFGPSPNDYTQTGATTFTTTSGSVTFAAGSSTATVTVDPEADTTAEADETIIITLAVGAGYNIVSPNSATGTILNDDTLVSVVVSPTSTAEGGANLVYTFTRTGPTGSALTVNFSVGGTASFPGDYSQSGATTFTPPTATVTFGAGSSTATVTVTPLTDCTVEGNETVDFTVQPGSGYGVGSPSVASGTIANTPDSTPPTITLIPNVNMTLWPPDHTYRSISVTDFVASASDNCDPNVDINDVYILKITSDEPENGTGDGNTLNDIVIAPDCKSAQLRSERSVLGDGRVYTITFKVQDSFGNFTTATAQVTVRTSPGNPAVNSGVMYTVNSSCP
jgi:Bacterial Ig domain/Calx-beta domain